MTIVQCAIHPGKYFAKVFHFISTFDECFFQCYFNNFFVQWLTERGHLMLLIYCIMMHGYDMCIWYVNMLILQVLWYDTWYMHKWCLVICESQHYLNWLFRYECGNFLKCVTTIQVLHKAMKGLGTDDSTLIRVIVTRTEVDMQYIKAEYSKKHRKTLNDAVHSETSGHYRAFLLSLLGPNI